MVRKNVICHVNADDVVDDDDDGDDNNDDITFTIIVEFHVCSSIVEFACRRNCPKSTHQHIHTQ